MNVPLTSDVTAYGRQHTAVFSSPNPTNNLDNPPLTVCYLVGAGACAVEGRAEECVFLKLLLVWISYENLFVIVGSVGLV